MKKFFMLLAALCLCLALVACGGNNSGAGNGGNGGDAGNAGGSTSADDKGNAGNTGDTADAGDAGDTGSAIDQTTFEELLAAGKANGNKLTIYSTHSVICTAAEAFANKFGVDVEIEATQIGDTNQITQVATEVGSGAAGADIIFIQDGARVLTDLVDEGYVYNWYNQEIYDAVGENAEPLLVWDYCNKVFIYNSDNVTDADVSNIWYATDPKYAGVVKMKDPFSEGVNMDFLTVLTSDENAEKLAAAYKDYYGTDIVLDADCPNAGYQWVKMVYNNGLVLGSSDGDIAQEIGAEGLTEPWTALITLNKYVKNLNTGYKLGYSADMKPVAGFIYPIYGLQTANADNPELAKAFLCWLFTEDGWFGDGETTINDGSVYVGMTGRQGDYSGNESIAVADGDRPVSEWKQILIVEDPEYAAEYRADMEDFLNSIK